MNLKKKDVLAVETLLLWGSPFACVARKKSKASMHAESFFPKAFTLLKRQTSDLVWLWPRHKGGRGGVQGCSWAQQHAEVSKPALNMK